MAGPKNPNSRDGHKSTPAFGEGTSGRSTKESRQNPMPGLTDQQIQRVQHSLRKWGRENYQSYPWRSDTDGWLTFVAEVFLQRTQARQVEKVYREFRRRYPSPRDFLEADTLVLSDLVGALGLAFRIQFLQEIARVAVKRNGALPETIEELKGFKGVGMYTAAAWLSLHRSKRAVLIDSNVARWLSRMTGNPYNRDPRHISWIKELAEKLTPPRAFRDYNYAVLDFTMQVCTPRKPSCEQCPFPAECLYGSSALTRTSGSASSDYQTEHAT